MFNHMSMPVLFAVLLVLLAVVSAGVFLAFRIFGQRTKADDEHGD